MPRRFHCPRFRELLPAFVGCFQCFSRRSKGSKKTEKRPVGERRNDKHSLRERVQVCHEISPKVDSVSDDEDRPHSADDICTSTKCRRSIEELFLDPTHVELGHEGGVLPQGVSLAPPPCRGSSKEFNYDFFATSVVNNTRPDGSRCLLHTQTQVLVARTLRSCAPQTHHVHQCGSRIGLYVEQAAEAALCLRKRSLDESFAIEGAEDKAFDYFFVDSCAEGATESCGRRRYDAYTGFTIQKLSESLVTVFRECRPQSASTDSASSADEEPRLRSAAPCSICGYFHSSAPRASGRDGRRFARHVQAMEKEQRERRQWQRQGDRCRTAPCASRGVRAFCSDLAYTEYYWRRNMRKHECPSERTGGGTGGQSPREEGEGAVQRSPTPAPGSDSGPATIATTIPDVTPPVAHDVILHYKVEGVRVEDDDEEEGGAALVPPAARHSRERHRGVARRANRPRHHPAPYPLRVHRTAAGTRAHSPPSPMPLRVFNAVAELRAAARQMQSGDCNTAARERVSWTTTRSTLRAGNKRRLSRGMRRLP